MLWALQLQARPESRATQQQQQQPPCGRQRGKVVAMEEHDTVPPGVPGARVPQQQGQGQGQRQGCCPAAPVLQSLHPRVIPTRPKGQGPASSAPAAVLHAVVALGRPCDGKGSAATEMHGWGHDALPQVLLRAVGAYLAACVRRARPAAAARLEAGEMGLEVEVLELPESPCW